jgi:hypothetical protein
VKDGQIIDANWELKFSDFKKRFDDFITDVNAFLVDMYSLISWMPFSAQNIILGGIGTALIIFFVFLLIKIIPFW